MLKKFAVSLCKTLLILIVGCGSLATYAAFAEKAAERSAASFCRVVKKGALTGRIREQAISLGAEERRTIWVTNTQGEAQLAAIFTGFTPISRYICNVTAKRGRVIRSEITYLD